MLEQSSGASIAQMACAITSMNYNTRGMHEQTEKLLVDLVLGAVERGSMERVTSAGKKVGTSPPD